jgi:hypothetical protein
VSFCFRICSAVITLALPLILNAMLDYEQSKVDDSMGPWLATALALW